LLIEHAQNNEKISVSPLALSGLDIVNLGKEDTVEGTVTNIFASVM